ncbi:MAG: DUF1525 domain-containing protein [Thiotrichales bacterium]|nr:DUF1525 domain-containing protein [Thiotrichales bacterium]
MRKLLLITAMLSLASPAFAEENIHDVKVWFDSNKAPVRFDYQFSDQTNVNIYDYAEHKAADEALNKNLNVSYGTDIKANEDMAKQAFNDFVNSDGYKAVQKKYGAFAKAIETSEKYQVTKAPTVVINDKYKVVGVNSISEAVRIFNEKVNP